MKRLIIVGSDSYIGKKLSIRLRKDNMPNLKISHFLNFKFDLLNLKLFDFSIIEKNDIIIFLAAVSSPDMCQNNFKESFQINVIGTIQFIEESIRRGAKVLFFSSDTVYGDTIGINDEEIKPFKPIGEYALMKLAVENYFQDEQNLKIFRLSYVFSWHDKFMSYLHQCRLTKTSADIFHPFTRKMIYINDIIDGIIMLKDNWLNLDQQIFNFCGEKYYSRLDIAKLYFQFVYPISYNIIDPPLTFYKARPEIIHISSCKTEELLIGSFTLIEDAIKNEKLKYNN